MGMKPEKVVCSCRIVVNAKHLSALKVVIYILSVSSSPFIFLSMHVCMHVHVLFCEKPVNKKPRTRQPKSEETLEPHGKS